jgi:DNA-binding MarR family transcriptional regulator
MHLAEQTNRQAEEVQAVLDAIRRIVQALRESGREAEAIVGVSGAQLFVLQVLAQEAPLCLADVAARTHTHPTSVSVVVKRLVDRGLVGRKRSKTDARRHDLALTKAGRALLASAPRTAQEQLVDGLKALSDRERRGLVKGLGRLIEQAGLGHGAPAMFFEEEEHP